MEHSEKEMDDAADFWLALDIASFIKIEDSEVSIYERSPKMHLAFGIISIFHNANKNRLLDPAVEKEVFELLASANVPLADFTASCIVNAFGVGPDGFV